MLNVKAYLGESLKRCRMWPRCNALEIPAVQTDSGFYCFKCAKKHPNAEIRSACSRAEQYRLSLKAELATSKKRSAVDVETRKRQIIEIYKKNPNVSKSVLAEELGLSTRTIDNYLCFLRSDGVALFSAKRQVDPSIIASATRELIMADPTIRPKQIAQTLGCSSQKASYWRTKILEEMQNGQSC